jgi:TRAP-type C4-dicarboxylate transport system substrate-binding protein
MKKLALLALGLVVILSMSFVVFACGGEDTTTTTAAPPTTAAPTTAPPTTAAPSSDTTAAPSSDTTAASTATTAAATTMDTTPIDGVEPIELTMVGFLPNVPPGSNWHNDFIKKVEDYSKGQMKIKFSGPEAVPAMDAPAAVQRGTVDIGSILSSFADSLVPGSGAIGRAEYSPMELRAKANEEGAFKYFTDEYAKKGIKYLGASVSSLPQVQTVLYLGKEINSLADLKGMKIASTGASNKAFIDSLGATTVPIDFTEYFTAMERGTVDGYNVGIPGILDFSLTPVTKAMLNEPFSSCGGMMLMNLKKWDSLTPKQQEVITKAMVNTEIDGAAMFTSTVDDVISKISADGVKVITLPPDEEKTFYLDYRDNMWAADIARWPDIGPKLKEWLVNPDFPRAN